LKVKLFLPILVFFLCGCGGDSDSASPATPVVAADTSTDASSDTEEDVINTSPVANAGRDLIRYINALVSLDASRSYDNEADNLSYIWSILSVPPGSAASLSDESSQAPEFVADQFGVYSFGLVVDDGEFASEMDTVTVTVDTNLVYENNFNQASIQDFVLNIGGDGVVELEDGQLRIDPPSSSLHDNYALLDMLNLSPGYSTILENNTSKIIWSFNVSNRDAPVCGACNNTINVMLSAVPADDSFFYGYNFIAGGLGGDDMIIRNEARWQSIYGNSTSTFIQQTNGISVLPMKAAIRIVYDPATSNWQLYFEQDIVYPDAQSVTNLAGEGLNNAYTAQNLRYLIFTSRVAGNVYIDNLTITYQN